MYVIDKQRKTFLQTMEFKILNSEYWTGYAVAVLGWIASFLAPLNPFLVFTVFLILADLYTGIKAAKKRGEILHSRGFSRTVQKITLYFIALLSSEGFTYVFFSSLVVDVPFTYIVAFTIALTEFKSVIENVETVTGVKIWASIKDKIPTFKK